MELEYWITDWASTHWEETHGTELTALRGSASIRGKLEMRLER